MNNSMKIITLVALVFSSFFFVSCELHGLSGNKDKPVPENFTASQEFHDRIELEWTRNVIQNDDYIIARSPTLSGTWTNYYASEVDSFSNTDVNPNCTYYYRIARADSEGERVSGWSPIVIGKTISLHDDGINEITIIQDFIPESHNNRPVYSMVPEYLTIHDTGNTDWKADAIAHAYYLKGDEATNKPVSWHFTVDDKQIVQHLPLNEVGWHAGDGVNGTGNRKSIGIEICMNADGDREKAEANAIWLVGYLIEKVDTLRPFPTCMKQHYDWSGKNCPLWIRSGVYHNWDSFLVECEREIKRR